MHHKQNSPAWDFCIWHLTKILLPFVSVSAYRFTSINFEFCLHMRGCLCLVISYSIAFSSLRYFVANTGKNWPFASSSLTILVTKFSSPFICCWASGLISQLDSSTTADMAERVLSGMNWLKIPLVRPKGKIAWWYGNLIFNHLRCFHTCNFTNACSIYDIK